MTRPKQLGRLRRDHPFPEPPIRHRQTIVGLPPPERLPASVTPGVVVAEITDVDAEKVVMDDPDAALTSWQARRIT